MCGIMGFTGTRPCRDLVFEGLQKLEYRGYDSSGIAVAEDGHIHCIKASGKLSVLEKLLGGLSDQATAGMGHTRWATHGPPSVANAHPHRHEGLAIIHNGILENYKELKIQLLEKGTKFASDTDSEIIVHLLKDELALVGDIKMAILNVLPQLKGAYGLGIMSNTDPDAIYLVKQGSPMVVGLGEGENLFASDALALLSHTKRFVFLEDGEIARISPNELDCWDFYGTPLTKEHRTLEQESTSYEKGGYRHFMHKEIHEQPAICRQTLQNFCSLTDNHLDRESLGLSSLDLKQIKRVHLTGCGTAYHAGLIGRYMFEELLKLPVEVELASELRYRRSSLGPNSLLVAMTQSGETADTLACVKLAKSLGTQTLSVCNVPFSSIPRETTSSLMMQAGPEIGVASTKAFTAMILDLYLFGLALAEAMETITKSELTQTLQGLKTLPALTEQVMASERVIEDIAGKYTEATSCLFIGRGMSFPIALEGALKLKEISYIHAEGYAGGELKHGPIALIDKNTPVVAIIPKLEPYRSKMLANVAEVCAREGRILGIGDADDSEFRGMCEDYIAIPTSADHLVSALLSVIPLQFFSYYVALHRGTDVDQPRNLAKSVTVE